MLLLCARTPDRACVCWQLVRDMLELDRAALSQCSGRSEEAAEVVFMKKADAERAMQRYNNVSLDGKAMQIELVAPTLAGRVVETLTSGLRCELAAKHHVMVEPMNSSATTRVTFDH